VVFHTRERAQLDVTDATAVSTAVPPMVVIVTHTPSRGPTSEEAGRGLSAAGDREGRAPRC